MESLRVERLPYYNDSSIIFECLRNYNMPVFIDSASPYCKQGRYDILSAEPFLVLKRECAISRNSLKFHNTDNFFVQVKKAISSNFPEVENSIFPFSGGAIGYFGYDLGREVETLVDKVSGQRLIPDGLVGLYGWGVIVDHDMQKTYLVSHGFADTVFLKEVKRKLTAVPISQVSSFQLNGDFGSNYSKSEYADAYHQIKRYINAGDCYQINLSQCYSAEYQGDPWQAYLKLRRAAAAPYSAYIEWDGKAVLSVSPERFLASNQPYIVTSPIKGTIKRGKDAISDGMYASSLTKSEKDRAENLMIVDLMRNDFGRCCEIGSVKVDKLFELQSFNTVHHLVSTISGKLKDDFYCLDAMEACFPGGSITGAPKIRAMEIIDELEFHQRSVYCGSIGYIDCNGNMDTNIAIRTMVCSNNVISCWAGGGIVADSSCEKEYVECMDKIEKLLSVL